MLFGEALRRGNGRSGRESAWYATSTSAGLEGVEAIVPPVAVQTVGVQQPGDSLHLTGHAELVEVELCLCVCKV